jgi:hypothetical protein
MSDNEKSKDERIAELLDALKPFADLADMAGDKVPGQTIMRLPLTELRRARIARNFIGVFATEKEHRLLQPLRRMVRIAEAFLFEDKANDLPKRGMCLQYLDEAQKEIALARVKNVRHALAEAADKAPTS